MSYWETVPGRTMPAYVALSLAWTRHMLGDAFLLLTPRNSPQFIGSAHLGKEWRFGPLPFDGVRSVLSVVAKSDYIRMAYVLHHGGVWLDADSIVLAQLGPEVFPELQDGRLHWFSEALFGASPGNALLQQAVRNCLQIGEQEWANPGSIRDLVAHRPAHVRQIPSRFLDPGYRPAYNFGACEVMLREDVKVNQFLSNRDLKLLKLYNTYFSRSMMGTMSVDAFLRSRVLLAKIFLKLNPDPAFWRARADQVLELIATS